MTLHWADLGLVVAIVVAGFAASYFLLLRRVRQLVSESHSEMERRMTALAETITTHQPRLAESVSSTDALDAREIESEWAAAVAETPVPRVKLREEPAASPKEELAPEIQAAIAAAAIAVLGKNARVRSARMVSPGDVVSPWTQQGRVAVQSSHNLRSRGRG